MKIKFAPLDGHSNETLIRAGNHHHPHPVEMYWKPIHRPVYERAAAPTTLNQIGQTGLASTFIRPRMHKTNELHLASFSPFFNCPLFVRKKQGQNSAPYLRRFMKQYPIQFNKKYKQG